MAVNSTIEAKGERHGAYSIIAAAGLLAALTLAFHGSALQGDWRFDDSTVLLYLIEHPDALGYFISPEQWRALSVPFFTPWLILDYWLDFHLFGLHPAAFYAHHLFFVWLAALLTFVLLLRYVGPWWAGMSAILFLLGSPVAVVSQQLMARHYATGLVFALLAILFWLRAERTGKRLPLALAAAFYLAAMLNKEVFAPLPLVLFFLGSAALKERLRAMFPVFLVATLFVAWRHRMLEKIVEGYIGGYTGSFHEAGNIAKSLATLPKVFFGEGGYALAGGAVLLLAAGLLLRRSSWRALAALSAAVIALSLPFLAVQVDPMAALLRFAFLPWWGACILLSLGFGGAFRRSGVVAECRGGHRRAGRHLAFLMVLMFSFVAVTKSLETARNHAAIAAEFDAQGRFLLTHDETVSYVPSHYVMVLFYFQYATSAVKKALFQTGAPTAIFFANSAHSLAANKLVYIYDPVCRCMRSERETAPAPARNEVFQPGMPLEIAIERPKNGLAWRFTVPADASCYMAFLDMNTVGAFPCAGRILHSLPERMLGSSFRLIALTAGGQWNFSPPLVFPDKYQKLEWPNGQASTSNVVMR